MMNFVVSVARTLWLLFWLPYGRAMSHRTYLSHAPFISTAARIAYLAVPVIVALWIAGVSLADAPAWCWRLLAGVALGLIISDTAHAVMDAL